MKVPLRRASPPAGHGQGVRLYGLVEAADHRRHMAVGGVVVVARPKEDGGNQADGIKAVLPAQNLTEFNAADLGDHVPLVGGLQRPSEKGLLADRLLGELRVDTAVA